MARAAVRTVVEGPVGAAEQLWYDPTRWPSFVDGFGHVVRVDEGWPAAGDNTGCMALKGASPEHEGDERPDRWPLQPHHAQLASRWGIDPAADLARRALAGAPATRA